MERGWGGEVWVQEAGGYCQLFGCVSLVNNDTTVVVKLIVLPPPAAEVETVECKKINTPIF